MLGVIPDGMITLSSGRIGLISDTHGLLRPEALKALSGVSHIVHAGDIGSPDILDELRKLAPVTAVRGNNDEDPWAVDVPERAALDIGGVRVLVIHDVKTLDAQTARDFQVVVAGHSHRPLIEQRNGLLLVNPGSAGRRRFKLPVSVGFLDITSQPPRAHIQELVV